MPLIFSYGGNTNPNQLHNQYPSHRVIGVGRLDGFVLSFDSYKLSPCSCLNTFTQLETSYCNLRKQSDAMTYGLVVELSDDDLAKMDRQECLGCIYERNLYPIHLSKEMHCWVYTMLQPVERLAPPTERYRNVVRIGYEHFNIPVDQLEQIEKYKKNVS